MKLHEIGDLSISSVPYTIDETDLTSISACWEGNFTINDIEYHYELFNGHCHPDIEDGEYGINVSFDLADPEILGTGFGMETTNFGDQYTLMSTIGKILKDYLNKFPEVKYISYESIGEKNNEGESKRFKLYDLYIKKNLPNWELVVNDGWHVKYEKVDVETPKSAKEKVRTHPEYLKAMERKKQEELKNLNENIQRIKSVMDSIK